MKGLASGTCKATGKGQSEWYPKEAAKIIFTTALVLSFAYDLSLSWRGQVRMEEDGKRQITIPKAEQPEEIPTWHSTPKEYMMETLVTCSQFSAGSKTFFFF